MRTRTSKALFYPQPIALTCIPFGGSDISNETSEEQKMKDETKRFSTALILKVSATCIRVPVFIATELSFRRSQERV